MSAVWLAGWLVCAAQVKDEERYLYVTKVKMEEAKNARRQSQKAKQVRLFACSAADVPASVLRPCTAVE